MEPGPEQRVAGCLLWGFCSTPLMDSPSSAHPGPHCERGSGAIPGWLMAHLAGEGRG